MDAIIERCCGLDVHRDSIMACLLTGRADKKPKKQRRTFGTMSRDLDAMAQWLRENECTHVAMESTGVYWMAPYKALEPHVELVVGNARHLSKVPGRKTDVLDSEWLAELLRHGLIKRSFIPPPPIRELRDLTRYRHKLVQSRSAERNRLQKLLETANIKLASVMSDVFGVSGMDMLHALVDGKLGPAEIAKLARGQLRKKMHLLTLALDAPLEEHHRYLLRTQLSRLEELNGDVVQIEQRIMEKLVPYTEQHARLMQIPGVDRIAASVLIAELGVDMSVFTSPQACAAWAGVSPGNNESAGKRKSGRTPRGNQHLKTLLVEAAQAASRKKGSYLRDKFHRLRARRGYKRAVVAIAHKILIAAYHMLATGEGYRELGEGYLDAKDEQRLTQRLVKRLEGLGYQVSLQAQESSRADDATANPDAGPSATDIPTATQEAEAPLSVSDERDATVYSVDAKRSMSSKGGTPDQNVASLVPLCEQDLSENATEIREGVEEQASTDTEAFADTMSSESTNEHTSERSSSASAECERVASTSDVAPSEPLAASTSSDASAGDQALRATPPASSEREQTASATDEPPLSEVARSDANERDQEPGPSSSPQSQLQNRRPPVSKRKRVTRVAKTRDARLPPVGTTLTRTFKGIEYQVHVLQHGFAYEGTFYSSISGVATAITGTSNNGYTFFRLTKKRKKPKPASASKETHQ